jgi:hypothetical protein
MTSANFLTRGVSFPLSELSRENVGWPMKRKGSSHSVASSFSEANYSADRESNSCGSDRPIYQQISRDAKRQRKERGDEVQETAKQKQQRETKYDAKNALPHVQATRGAAYVPPSIGRSTFFNGSIDLTTVKHVVSSKVSHNYLVPERFNQATALYQSDEGAAEIPQMYASLADATRSFYAITTAAEENDSELSDNSYAGTGTGDNKETGLESVTPTESCNSSPVNRQRHPLEMTLDNALSLCQDPRIVTKARAPHSVVHVNAAFCRLFGASGSQHFLARPLNEVLSSESRGDHTEQMTKYLEASLTSEDLREKGELVTTVAGEDMRKSLSSTKCCMSLLGLVASEDDSVIEQELSMKSYGHCVFGLTQVEESVKDDSNNIPNFMTVVG